MNNGGWVNPLSGAKGAQLSLSGGYTGGTYYSGEASWSASWSDPNPEIRPNTVHTVTARVSNDGGWSGWGGNCGPRTAMPPAVGTPTMYSSINDNDITFDWTSASNAGWYEAWNSSASYRRYVGVGTVTTAYNQPYGVSQCAMARAAYNQRLASWGWWGGWSNISCRTPVDPVPAAPSCIRSGSQYNNTAFDMTNLSVFPCLTANAAGYAAQVWYRSSVDYIDYYTITSYNMSLGFFEAAWGGHSDWVKIRMRARSAAGTWSGYSSWMYVPRAS